MKAYLIPALLQVIGIMVIIAEIFIPSLGVLAVIALALLSYSLYIVFQAYPQQPVLYLQVWTSSLSLL